METGPNCIDAFVTRKKHSFIPSSSVLVIFHPDLERGIRVLFRGKTFFLINDDDLDWHLLGSFPSSNHTCTYLPPFLPPSCHANAKWMDFKQRDFCECEVFNVGEFIQWFYYPHSTKKTIPSLDIVMFIRLTDAMKRGNIWKEKEFENLCAIIIRVF